MIFVTGPMFAGKKECLCSLTGWSPKDLADYALWEVQELAADCEDLPALADRLAEHPAVIASEIGSGIVPLDPAERRKREAAGRLACLLAERAEVVIRVCCGLPQVLKGDLSAALKKGGENHAD